MEDYTEEAMTQNNDLIPGDFWNKNIKAKYKKNFYGPKTTTIANATSGTTSENNNNNQLSDDESQKTLPTDDLLESFNQLDNEYHEKMQRQTENFKENCDQYQNKNEEIGLSEDLLASKLLGLNFMDLNDLSKRMKKKIFNLSSNNNSISNKENIENEFSNLNVDPNSNSNSKKSSAVNSPNPIAESSSKQKPNLDQTLSIPQHQLAELLADTEKRKSKTRCSNANNQKIHFIQTNDNPLKEGESTIVYLNIPGAKLYPLKIPVTSENIAVLNRINQDQTGN